MTRWNSRDIITTEVRKRGTAPRKAVVPVRHQTARVEDLPIQAYLAARKRVLKNRLLALEGEIRELQNQLDEVRAMKTARGADKQGEPQEGAPR